MKKIYEGLMNKAEFKKTGYMMKQVLYTGMMLMHVIDMPSDAIQLFLFQFPTICGNAL